MNERKLEKAKHKIRQALEISISSSSASERKAAQRMAIMLMQKYKIGEGEINKEQLVSVIKEFPTSKIPVPERTLMHYIGQGLGVFVVMRTGRGGRKGILSLTGTQSDIDIADYFYEVVLTHIDMACIKEKVWAENADRKHMNDYRKGLCIGFGQSFIEAQKEVDEELVGTGLVPIDDRYFDAEQFYKQDHKVSKNGARTRASASLHKGMAEGKNIKVNHGVNHDGSGVSAPKQLH